jgi:hypothetical protein
LLSWDWLFRNHIQLVPILGIPHIIHFLIPSSYHSSMCMCKRYRITLLELQNLATSDRLSIPMAYSWCSSVSGSSCGVPRLTASPYSTSHRVLRNGPVVQTEIFSPLRRTEASPPIGFPSKFVVMLLSSTRQKSSFPFARVQARYDWAIGSEQMRVELVEKWGDETAACWACSRHTFIVMHG